MYGRSATKRCIDKSGSRAGNWGLLRCDAAALEQRIKALPLYLSHAVLGMRAAGDGPNRRSLPKPSRFVGSNQLPPVTRSPGGGLPTVYQGLFSVAREGLKVVPVFNMAQATLRRRSAIDRRARPWL